MRRTKIGNVEAEQAPKGLLKQLLSDKRGASAVMMAAAVIPIIGVIGGGLDVGRTYLAKSKLQAACDSGVLAGRKLMATGGWTATSTATANAYFDVNFNNGKYGSTDLTRSFSSPDGEKVIGTATAKVPTTLMKIFGFDNMDLSIQCEAVMNLPNTDIMFVLDTTGSMAQTNSGDPSNRITMMRSSVLGFYDAIESARSGNTQVRYGFVPYAANVNVGGLLKREWMTDTWSYQTRTFQGSSGQTNTEEEWGYLHLETANGNESSSSSVASALDEAACTSSAPANSLVVDSDYASNPPYVPYTNAAGRQVIYWRHTQNGTNYSALFDAETETCTIKQWNYNNRTWISAYEVFPPGTRSSTASNWLYHKRPFDVSSLKGGTFMTPGASITAPVGSLGSNVSITWAGCVEERDTTKETSFNLDALPFDLDIERVPTAGVEATQWRPALPGLVFPRRELKNLVNADFPTTADIASMASMGATLANCPSPARKLASYVDTDPADNTATTGTRAQFSSYLNSLTPSGYTHHDIGMIWGLRLLHRKGLFETENTFAPAGGTINRNLILMTDGKIETRVQEYDAYGLSGLDQRRHTIPSGQSQGDSDKATNALVETRLLTACDWAKANGITVWVIAFGTDLTTMLKQCATSQADHAFHAKNAAGLNTAFQLIAGKISNLRLKE